MWQPRRRPGARPRSLGWSSLGWKAPVPEDASASGMYRLPLHSKGEVCQGKANAYYTLPFPYSPNGVEGGFSEVRTLSECCP